MCVCAVRVPAREEEQQGRPQPLHPGTQVPVSSPPETCPLHQCFGSLFIEPGLLSANTLANAKSVTF